MHNDPPRYRKKFGVLRNATIRAEIASLDAEKDCQRIVHLLACYEFPLDITRSLELALFHTYGSVSVSRLLDKTGEFKKYGQKRYDDTRLLISHFLEDGYDGEYGRRAIERMNGIHQNKGIPNDDFLFVLSTFIVYPVNWVRKHGYRPFTAHEEQAWFAFFRNVGQKMQIRSMPDTPFSLQRWVDSYEAENLVYADSNRNVAHATIAVFEAWFPWPLKGVVQPTVNALIDARLRPAFGFGEPPRLLSAMLFSGLSLRRLFMKWFNIERHPKLIANTRNRTYPGNRYTIEGIAPSYARQDVKTSQPPHTKT